MNSLEKLIPKQIERNKKMMEMIMESKKIQKHNEIKEILEYMKKVANKNEEDSESELSHRDCALLLDCITNLQKENEILRKNAEHNDKVVDKAKWNEMIYKSRNEKAIEYIKEHIKYECDDIINGMSFYSYHLYNFKKDELLNILQGEDKDE